MCVMFGRNNNKCMDMELGHTAELSNFRSEMIHKLLWGQNCLFDHKTGANSSFLGDACNV